MSTETNICVNSSSNVKEKHLGSASEHAICGQFVADLTLCYKRISCDVLYVLKPVAGDFMSRVVMTPLSGLTRADKDLCKFSLQNSITFFFFFLVVDLWSELGL